MTVRRILYQLHPRHLRWWQWFGLILIGLVFIVRSWLPVLLRQQILSQLASLTPAHVQLGDVDVNFLRGHVVLQQLSFTLDDSSQPALVIDNLAVNVSLRSLLRREIKLESVHLKGVQVEAIQAANKQLNLTRLFLSSPPKTEQPSSDLPTLTIQHTQITDSRITYRDLSRSPEARFNLAIAALTAADIALQANGLAAPVTVQLKGMLDNGPLNSETQVLWQREQTSIEANIEAQQLALALLAPYLREALAVQKLAGQVRVQLHYRYHDGQLNPVHSLDGTATLSQVQFVDPANQNSTTKIADGSIEIRSIDFLKQQVEISAVNLKAPQLLLLRTPTGFNATSWIRPADELAGKQASPEQARSDWSFTLQTVKLSGGEITYRDSTWAEEEKLTLHPEEIILERLGKGMTSFPFQFRTRLGAGSVTGDGEVWFAAARLEGEHSQEEPARQKNERQWPFAVLQLSLQPTSLELSALQPLLTPLLAAKKVRGEVTGKLQAHLSELDGVRIFRTVGDIETKNFALADMPELGQTIGWERGSIVISEGSQLIPFSLSLKPDLSQVTLRQTEHSDLLIENIVGDVRLAQTTASDDQQQVAIVGTLNTTKLLMNGLPATTNILTWDAGQLEFRDDSTLVPLRLNFKTQIAQFSLRQLPQGDVAIEKASGELQLIQEVNEQQLSVLKAQGPIEFTDFTLTHGEEKQVLLGCYQGKATLSEGSRLAPFDIKLREVALEYAYAQGLRSSTGQFQLFIPPTEKQNLDPSDPTLAQAEPMSPPRASDVVWTISPTELISIPTHQATPEASVSVQIDRATIIGGQLYFEDRTVNPPQTVYWQDVRVDLSQVGYPVRLPATFSAFAYNEEGSPVEVKGTTERKGDQVLVRVHGKVEKMSLSRFNSYLEPNLGYRVKKGAVSATWDLRLPGDRVQANMNVTLHDIDLGGKQQTSTLEQQVGLPLTLVVALLKDLNGDINLHLPVQGNVNDPGFQWNGTIVRAIRDVLVGAVTSPLKLIGALFKKKDKLEGFTLEPIRFVSGTSQLADGSKEQLSRLALFLTQRPNLDLRFSGVTGPDDIEFLRDQTILSELSVRPAEDRKEGESTLPLTPEEEVRQFLTQKQIAPEGQVAPSLSSQAAGLLTQLRERTKVPTDVSARLASERVQVVIAELTTRHAIPADRLHISPEKQRGAGSAEVRYTLQTREEKESSQ